MAPAFWYESLPSEQTRTLKGAAWYTVRHLPCAGVKVSCRPRKVYEVRAVMISSARFVNHFCEVEAGHLPAFKEVVAGSEEQEAWYRNYGDGKWDYLPINQRPEEPSCAIHLTT